MITAPRAILLLTGATMALTAMPLAAQVNDAAVLNIMRECAKIDGPTARLACYDNNIRAAGANPSSVPGQMPSASGSGAPLQSNGPGGFGADDLRTAERFNPARNGVSEISARISSVREREPGVYLVTLESGAQWLFTESGGRAYQAPRRGDTVEIQRGALGGYLMVVGKQQAMRVMRIK